MDDGCSLKVNSKNNVVSLFNYYYDSHGCTTNGVPLSKFIGHKDLGAIVSSDVITTGNCETALD